MMPEGRRTQHRQKSQRMRVMVEDRTPPHPKDQACEAENEKLMMNQLMNEKLIETQSARTTTQDQQQQQNPEIIKVRTNKIMKLPG